MNAHKNIQTHMEKIVCLWLLHEKERRVTLTTTGKTLKTQAHTRLPPVEPGW